MPRESKLDMERYIPLAVGITETGELNAGLELLLAFVGCYSRETMQSPMHLCGSPVSPVTCYTMPYP